MRHRQGVSTNRASWAGAVHGVAAAKGWWQGGIYRGHEDLRGHGGARVYRRWVSETGWLQYWLRRRTGLTWMLYDREATSGVRVTCV